MQDLLAEFWLVFLLVSIREDLQLDEEILSMVCTRSLFIYLFSFFIKVAVLSWSDGYLCLQGEAPVFIPDDLTGGGLDWEIGLKLKDCQRAVNIGNKTVRFCSGKDLNLFYTMGVYYLFNNTNFDCFVIFLIWSVCNRWCWSWVTIDNWCFHIWQIYWWMVSVYIYIYILLCFWEGMVCFSN